MNCFQINSTLCYNHVFIRTNIQSPSLPADRRERVVQQNVIHSCNLSWVILCCFGLLVLIPNFKLCHHDLSRCVRETTRCY